MGKEFVVLQGKTFFVELQSMLGSTNYGWCVRSMPKEVILIGMDNIPVREGIAPVIQRFYFGVTAADNSNAEIDFVLTCLTNLADVSDEFKASIRIVPSDSEEFTAYSENDINSEALYGFVYTGDKALKYGYPCNTQGPAVKYGYPCGVRDAGLKYGYPCGVRDANLKYGYPCAEYTKDSRPYGLSFMELTKDSRPYGFPFMD